MEDVKQVVSEQKQANPGRLSTNFMYKAAIVAVFLVIIPLFPSQAPDFINQTLLTRSWELLHLLFVGIAVSYGLFSRRNEDDDSDKETHNSKFDNAQSYVSGLLQVSSVFDDDTEPEAETETESSEKKGKVQTWSSQYFRNEPPMVVVGQDHSVVDEQRPREKPLLLPVRRLKSRVPDPNCPEPGSGSKRVSGGSRNREPELGQNLVLPSPIPWRSRSGRLETKEEEIRTSPNPSPRPLYNRPSPIEESELDQSKSAKPQIPRPSRPNSAGSSPKGVSAESQAKSVEDFVRKKTFQWSPPPPPPPPPPPTLPKSQSFKSTISHVDHERDLSRSFSYSTRNKTHVDNQGTSVRTTTKGRENGLSVEEDSKKSDRSSGSMGKPRFEEYEEDEGSEEEGPDVDKKADEFIAKFREQIRLQRIESIKKSSGQMSRNFGR